MAEARDDSLQAVCIQLDGKNYAYWSYVMKNFLKGKQKWGYISGAYIKPQDDVALLDKWEVDNSKIITWINNSVKHLIGTQLAKYKTAKELALTEPAELRVFGPYIVRREERRLVQFLMALRDEFEGLRGSILHRHPLPSVDSVVSEFLAEEIRLKSSVIKEVSSASTPSVFAMPPRSNSKSQFRPYGSVARDECGFCKQKGHWKS
ncbi:uncharacterized protein LOC125370938 [Ricinus communis]|uniref:uncharacterized protein LOC125370938 n=1 Tax=Ricinus communis TaxID=3988 RepID=UPI0007725143|nr:uncharacterized protein LOC125370938 [Ricinus communis]|eukprot:XP_015581177.1 uncharacterized protein LOC107262089 [Ricinus communis]